MLEKETQKTKQQHLTCKAMHLQGKSIQDQIQSNTSCLITET